MVKQQCVNCQFLCKIYVDNAGKESSHNWNEEDRNLGTVKERYAAACALGIWSTQVDPRIDPKDEIYKNRRRDCFAFIEIHDGMTFPAAEELLDRRQQFARSSRERVMEIIAVLGWATAAVVAGFNILKYFISQ